MSTLASVIVRDLFANRPSAGVAGRLFFASDSGDGYYDDGTSWHLIASSSSGGGYSAGTTPSFVQVAHSINGTNSATFGSAPASGNLLVAMCFNPTSDSVGSGWTKQTEISTGTDYGIILTKVAGGTESTTQTPLSGVSSTGGMVIWELHGQNGTTPFVYGQTQAEATGAISSAILIPNTVNCLGLAAVAVVSPQTIVSAINVTATVINSSSTASRNDLLRADSSRLIVARLASLSRTAT